MMSSTGSEAVRGKNIETIRREWARSIEKEILEKRSKIRTQVQREAESENRITLMSLLEKRYYVTWWNEFVSRYPGVTILIFMMSLLIGVLLGCR